MVCVCGSVTVGAFECSCWAVGFFLVGITLSGVGSTTCTKEQGPTQYFISFNRVGSHTMW